jgi:hypothetical protein
MEMDVQPVREIHGPLDTDRFMTEIVAEYRPVVLRGQMAAWPAVQQARQSDEAIAAYLSLMDSGRPLAFMAGPPEIEGRFFYDDAVRGYNFQLRSGNLSGLLNHLLGQRVGPQRSAVYAGGAVADDYLSNWQTENAFPFSPIDAQARIWIGNKTRISTHMDETHNVAAVVAGKRRFTLFPPDQLDNLYVGPLHFTIAGPPVSMVDLEQPDFDRFPRFAQALDHALVADLEPGDAIYIPAIWWHNVRADAAFNVMMNYWWGDPDAGSALNALILAIKAVRDLAPEHRGAWRHWFNRFAFDDDAAAMALHLPEHAQGYAGPASPERTAFIRTNRDGASD